MKIIPIQVNQILTKTSGFIQRCGFDYSVNPALGCAFGCSYCYAEAFTQIASPGPSWGHWSKLKSNAGELIRAAPSLNGKKLYMASVTDPYQSAEREMGVTRGILEALHEKHSNFTLVIQTRGPLIVRDLELLRAMMAHSRIQVNFSITTDSDDLRKRFEPTCPSIEARFHAVEELCQAGIPTAVTVTPMLPLKDPKAFAVRLGELELSSVVIQCFHADQNDRKLVRGTPNQALEVMRQLGVTRQMLYAQSVEFAKLVRQQGLVVGMNEAGFKAP
jgi:DNA repair photolyase